jgi:O-antigen/teichoic acid export membrane protein
MSELRKLYWESSHYLAGRVAVMLLGFVSFPLFTRVFSVSEYGIMSLVLNTVMVLTAFSKLGMQSAVQRFYPEHANSPDPKAFQRYYSTLFFGAALIGGICTLLYVGTVYVIPASLMGSSVKFALVFASGLIVIRTLRSMQTNLMQIERKTILLNVSDIINRAGTIAAIVLLFFVWQRGIKSYFLGSLIFEGLVVLAFVPSLLKRKLLSVRAFEPGFFRTVISFSVPLMWAELAWLVLDTGDRYLIGHYLGTEAIGYYAAAYGVAYHVQDLVNVPLGLALFPVFMKLWSTEGEKAAGNLLSRSLDHFVMAAILMVCTFTVVSRDLIVLLASRKYESAHVLLPWLVSGLVLSAGQIFFKPGLLVHKKVFKVARVTLYAAIINIVLNVVMLPRIGVKGAAIATLLSYAAWIFMMARESLAIFHFEIRYFAFAKYLIAGAAVVLVASRVQVPTLILSILVKGIVSVIVYCVILWIVDAQFRDLMRSGVKWLAGLGHPVAAISPAGAGAVVKE